MIINYNINKINYKATFCHNKESPDIYKALSKLYCDKKLLLIIDKRLNAKFTKFLFKDLKKCGLKVTLLKVSGSKKNKNKKFLFKIIDKLIEKKFTKKSIYQWAKKTKPLFKNYAFNKFFINTPKNQLLKNIELRTKSMIEKKCINEVIEFKKKRLKKSLSPNKIIGVQEIQRFLSGDLDQKNLIELMNIKTRQYAKRQKTWSRAHMSDWHMIYSSKSSILLKKILKLVS